MAQPAILTPAAPAPQAERQEAAARPKRFGRSASLWVLLFLAIFALHIVSGTDAGFAALVLSFNLMGMAAVYAVGGLGTVLGASVGLLAFQHITFSTAMKAIFGQRPDTPLLEPMATLWVYNIGMAGVLLAALITLLPPIRNIRPILVAEIRPDRLRVLAVMLTAFMVLRYVGFAQFGAILGVLSNFEFLTPMAVAASTAYVVVSSDKKRCIGLLTVINLVIPLMSGIAFGQRKEASYAVVIFAVTAIVYGFRPRVHHWLVGLVVIYAFQFILFPYALYARSQLSGRDFLSNAGQSWDILTDVVANPGKYQEKAKAPPPISDYDSRRMFYFGQPDPTLDRFSVLITTDALIRSTEEIGTTGWQTISQGLRMVIPRAFNPDKTQVGTSNWIAHRARGIVGPTDFRTSITLGYFVEAYVAFRWMGVIFVPFIASLIFFLVYRLAVDVRLKNNFWAAALFVTLPWTFSEGTIQQNSIMTLQMGPLAAATGLIFLIMANTLCRRRNLQSERVETPPPAVFESKSVKVAG